MKPLETGCYEFGALEARKASGRTFVKRLRAPILIGGVLFHLGTLFFMNIFFPYHLAMCLVFID